MNLYFKKCTKKVNNFELATGRFGPLDECVCPFEFPGFFLPPNFLLPSCSFAILPFFQSFNLCGFFSPIGKNCNGIPPAAGLHPPKSPIDAIGTLAPSAAPAFLMYEIFLGCLFFWVKWGKREGGDRVAQYVRLWEYLSAIFWAKD
jgi:hypothetical protein